MTFTAILLALLAPASAQLVEVSPTAGLCDSVKQYSGYYKLTTGDKHYFYWAFESRSKPSTDPVLLWMTGGPGCSSAVALFGENGPCHVNENGTATMPNAYSWNQHATVIYIDQPAGTGFSYGVPDAAEKAVANDMYSFLQAFFQAHPQFQANPFFTFGESFAGHYVPAVTHKIWENNRALPTGAVKINLQGVAIGNGLTDPLTQFKYYADMAVSTNDHKPAVNNVTHALMKAATGPCIAAIKACQAEPVSCILAIDTCNIGLLLPYQASGMNPYDMREKCQVPPLCYDFSNVAKFLARPEVQDAIGVNPHRRWEDCNRGIALMFELSGDWMQSYQTMIPDQLADGIRVLIYAGDQDFICNHLGNHAWTNAMVWTHQAEYNSTALVEWKVAGKAAGLKQSAANFTFLRVYDAGHMVPRDQPEHALEMVNAFLANRL